MPSKEFDRVRAARNRSGKMLEQEQITPEEYAQMQETLGEQDRYYSARDQTEQRLLDAAGLALLIPGDYIAKKSGLVGGRSQPTLESVRAGYAGIGEGLSSRYNQLVAKLLRNPSRLPDSPSPDDSPTPARIDRHTLRAERLRRLNPVTPKDLRQEIEDLNY